MDIYEHIPLGKENAIHSCDLEKITGCESSSELRKLISTARINGTADGTVICSNSSDGYWRSRDITEMRDWKASVRTWERKGRSNNQSRTTEDGLGGWLDA